jgi:hypothetical protein
MVLLRPQRLLDILPRGSVVLPLISRKRSSRLLSDSMYAQVSWPRKLMGRRTKILIDVVIGGHKVTRCTV